MKVLTVLFAVLFNCRQLFMNGGCVTKKCYQLWKPDFSNPQFFDTPYNSNQKWFPYLQSNTVIFPPTFRPIIVSLGGSRNRDSTVRLAQSSAPVTQQ